MEIYQFVPRDNPSFLIMCYSHKKYQKIEKQREKERQKKKKRRITTKRDTVNQQKKSGQRRERKYLVKIRVLNKVNHTLNIRNQACREQQIQQTKAAVVKKRKITSRRTKKKEHLINIYPMYSIVSRNKSRRIINRDSEGSTLYE